MKCSGVSIDRSGARLYPVMQVFVKKRKYLNKIEMKIIVNSKKSNFDLFSFAISLGCKILTFGKYEYMSCCIFCRIPKLGQWRMIRTKKELM